MICFWFSHTQSCRFTSFQNARKSFVNFVGCTTPTILWRRENQDQHSAHETRHLTSECARKLLVSSCCRHLHSLHTTSRGSSGSRVCTHLIRAWSERHSSTLSFPFHPTSSSLYSPSISSSSYCPSTSTGISSNNVYSANKEMESNDESYLHTSLVLCYRRHQPYKHNLSCVSQFCGGFLHCSLSVICKALLPGIWTTIFLRAALTMSLNYLSTGSMKYIPLNCLALSSSGFSMAHLCLAFFFAASNMRPHIWTYIVRTRGILFSCKSHPDHENPSGGLPFSRTNIVNPVHASDAVFVTKKYVQWRFCFSGNVDVLHRNRKCFISRHVQFDSWYNVMTINEFSFDRPEVIFSFPALSLLEVGLENLIHLTFLEEFLLLRLFPDDPGLRWMFPDAVLTHRFWLFHLRLGKWSFHFFTAITLALHWVSLRGFLLRPSPSILQCLWP